AGSVGPGGSAGSAGWHLPGPSPVEQTPLRQSVGRPQLLPFGQAAQTPPQSTSDSSWFFVPSSQDGFSAQTPSAQWPLVQSAGPWQACPIGQWGHPPPQSVSDSSWFRRPSKHVGRSTQASDAWILGARITRPDASGPQLGAVWRVPLAAEPRQGRLPI